jgi:hypothetical protein
VIVTGLLELRGNLIEGRVRNIADDIGVCHADPFVRIGLMTIS